MPFSSQRQRGLFYAAKNDPAVRQRTGISQATADKMTSEDPGGKLPMRVPKMAKGGRIEAFAGTETPEEEALEHRAILAGHRMPESLQAEHLRGYARGGRPSVGDPVVVGEEGPEVFVADKPGTIVPNEAAFGQHRSNVYGSGDVRYKQGLLAHGSGHGRVPVQPNRMSALPGSSDIAAKGPGPRSAPKTPGLATWGALHGIKRGASPGAAPKGHMGKTHPLAPKGQPIGAKAPPKANPVGMGPARHPIAASAPRQMR